MPWKSQSCCFSFLELSYLMRCVKLCIPSLMIALSLKESAEPPRTMLRVRDGSGGQSRLRFAVPLFLFCIFLSLGPAGAEPEKSTPASELQSFPGCALVEADWADGDSFPVLLPDGRELTVRLYGADAIELHVRNKTDADRLLTQRRYFGLAAGDARTSIPLAKEFGAKAAQRVVDHLKEPFTVHTAFAEARGDKDYPRVYAFVETAEGNDLAAKLVEEGLARAFGVFRATPDGRSADAYRDQLKDLELSAAGKRIGIWSETDWASLPKERTEQRNEDLETAIATGSKIAPTDPINPNTASRDELMRLPGIGEAFANRIIEARSEGPYKTLQDLARVRGIGPPALEKLGPYLIFP